LAALLDTCVLIDLLRGFAAAIDAVQARTDTLYVCDISLMELYGGVRSTQEEARVERLISLFRPAPMPQPVYRAAGQYLRHYDKSHALGAADALISATADYYGLRLLTLNVKHFPMLKGLRPAY
jgi:hypothetical protein